MTEFDTTSTAEKSESTAVPFEALPQLAANEEFIARADELREVKEKFDYFSERLDALKMELGAAIAVAGAKSVAYYDLRITNADGGMVKGKVTGSAILAAIAPTTQQLMTIAESAKDCDAAYLVEHGIPASVVAVSRTPDKPRAGSTRVEWIGAKGKGASNRRGGGSARQ